MYNSNSRFLRKIRKFGNSNPIMDTKRQNYKNTILNKYGNKKYQIEGKIEQDTNSNGIKGRNVLG